MFVWKGWRTIRVKRNAVVSFDWLMCDFDKKCFYENKRDGKE